MKIKIYLIYVLILVLVSGCVLSPGMFMSSSNNWNGENSVYIDSLDQSILIEEISNNVKDYNVSDIYKIGRGDELNVTIWGLPEVFPISGINPELNLRRVDSNGNIFFPFVGLIAAQGKTQDQLRQGLTSELSKLFKNVQLDITIANFNS